LDVKKMASTLYDITIIGGGPIGLFAAATAGEMGALCNIVESRFHLGGTMMAAYPDKDVFNFPGIVTIKGRDLVNNLIARARADGLVARYGEYVHNISPGSAGTIVVKSNKNEYVSSAAIITTGLKAFYSPLVDYIRIQDWEGFGVYDDWPPATVAHGRSIAILRGNAQDQKIPQYLKQSAGRIFEVLDERWAQVSTSSRDGKDGRVEFYQSPWTVKEIAGLRIPETLILSNELTDETLELKIEMAVGFYDSQARQTVYSNLGIAMTGQQIKVDQRMQTSLKRVFAAGDIAWYTGKVMVLSAGIYEAKIAVKNALKLI
jgi:thioredoxin reductase (NADPH)